MARWYRWAVASFWKSAALATEATWTTGLARTGTPELYTPGIGWTALPGAYSADIQLNWFYPRVWMSSNGNDLWLLRA